MVASVLKPKTTFVVVFLPLLFSDLVGGHGVMVSPTPRSANSITNHCGNAEGYSMGVKQLENPGNNCGVCGDWLGYEAPRNSEYMGTEGRIGPTMIFRKGDAITLSSNIFASHAGFVQFRLCVDARNEEQACFDQYLFPIEKEKRGTRTKTILDYDLRQLNVTKNGIPVWVSYTSTLPPNLTCDFCVIQFNYRSGNFQNNDPSDLDKFQQTFRSCADIRIVPEDYRGEFLESDAYPDKCVSLGQKTGGLDSLWLKDCNKNDANQGFMGFQPWVNYTLHNNSIMAGATDKCIVAEFYSNSPSGTPVHQWDCTRNINQLWGRLNHPTIPQKFALRNKHFNLKYCMKALGNLNIVLGQCDSSDSAQYWTVWAPNPSPPNTIWTRIVTPPPTHRPIPGYASASLMLPEPISDCNKAANCDICGMHGKSDFSQRSGPTAVYRQGSNITLVSQIFANSYTGFVRYRLCTYEENGSQACFDQNVLPVLADGQKRLKTTLDVNLDLIRINYPGESVIVNTTSTLPPFVTCDRCTIQMTYNDGNSSGLVLAERIIKGCSDVRIVPEDYTGQLLYNVQFPSKCLAIQAGTVQLTVMECDVTDRNQGIIPFQPWADYGLRKNSLMSGSTDKCIVGTFYELNPGTPVTQYTCTRNVNQLWGKALKAGDPTKFALKNAHLQLCMSADSDVEGNVVRSQKCNVGDSRQYWTLLAPLSI